MTRQPGDLPYDCSMYSQGQGMHLLDLEWESLLFFTRDFFYLDKDWYYCFILNNLYMQTN